LAAGATSTYFGKDDWRPYAPALKTIDDALDIRRRVLSAYEAAELETDPDTRRALLTFVVVGGGPTGVELAGTIIELARQTLRGEFRNCNPAETRVILLQSNEHVLPEYPDELSHSARRQLEHLGVEVRTGQRVTHVSADSVQAGGETIPARTILWTAGVAASPLAKTLGVPLDKGGRVLVSPDLSIPDFPEVFVVGDLAAVTQDGQPLPGVAQVAIQGGQSAARNIAHSVKGEPRETFVYHDRGTMATIGRAAAVADLKRVKLTGVPAWLAWLFIHLLFLIGFENRVLVLWNWAWSYLTYQRGSRLITGHSSIAGTPAGMLPSDAQTAAVPLASPVAAIAAPGNEATPVTAPPDAPLPGTTAPS
ncbi:MAG TPA: NAD(P)/FAD-dependent oxidoreductase, partial [Armatimonadota bacterium]|nr:NAD(P)/FAD-dependent oxidoreductase [Armatimonadota bacterium]